MNLSFQPSFEPAPQQFTETQRLNRELEETDHEIQIIRAEIKRGEATEEQSRTLEKLFQRMDSINAELERLEKDAANDPSFEQPKLGTNQ